MRIGIDARLVTYRRGMGNFVHNLLMELAKLPGAEQYILYVDDVRAAEYTPHDPRFVITKLSPKFYPLWEQISLPLALARDRVDLLHCPANTAPLLLPPSLTLALTVHDVMYALPKSVVPQSPSVYQRIGRLYYRLFARRAVKRARYVMADSQHSLHDIVRIFHVPVDRLRLVYVAGNPMSRRLDDRSQIDDVKQRYRISGEYILAMGALDPRKNTVNVLSAFARFRTFPVLPIQLVITGLARDAMRRFSTLVATMALQDHVILLGFVSDEELVLLYNGASVYVYPSLYEGFGMPVVEAMACGTPVITSSAGSIPEVAGDAPLFIDPRQPDDIAQAIRRVLSDEPLRQRMIERGLAQAKRFSWTDTAQQVLDVYRTCAKS